LSETSPRTGNQFSEVPPANTTISNIANRNAGIA
jgi:hypothetical protein